MECFFYPYLCTKNQRGFDTYLLIINNKNKGTIMTDQEFFRRLGQLVLTLMTGGMLVYLAAAIS